MAHNKEMVDQFMVDLKKVKVIYNRSTLFASFGTDIIILVAALFCAMMPLGEKMELGKILALLLSIPNVSNMIFSIPALRNSWQQSMEGMKTLDDIFQMADKQTEIKILERENIDCVRVKNMSFWYQKQEKMIFENLNIEMSKGIHLIKGNSGCGKSTFMRILAGELPILSGTLELGEKTINANTREDFNSYIEYMPQTPIVINKTLCENIVMGQEVNKQRLGQAIYYAGLKDMVEKLPQGVETMVSSEKLSSGEKQKIALARVFYQDKPVWVLDEPTSALDPVSIKKILKSIEECAENKIVILSSHQSIEENNKMKVYSWENTGNRRGE